MLRWLLALVLTPIGLGLAVVMFVFGLGFAALFLRDFGYLVVLTIVAVVVGTALGVALDPRERAALREWIAESRARREGDKEADSPTAPASPRPDAR